MPGSDFDSLSAGQSRQVTFSYQTRDVHDSFSVPGTVTVTVSGDNDPPMAGNLSLAAVEDGLSVSGLLPGDDINSNDDPDTLTYRLLTVPPAGQGSVILSGVRTIEFNPGGDFQNLSTGQTQPVFFSYQVTDRFGIDAPTPGTVTVTVTGQNDAPVVSNLATLLASEDGAPVGGSFIGQDADDGAAALVYSIVTQPSEGLVTPIGLAGFEFNPGTGFQNLASGQQRTVTFTYRATDPTNAQSNVGTGTVTVTGANDAPVAQNVAGVAAQEDGGSVAGNFNAIDVDSDENGSGIVYSINTPPAPGNGSVLPLSGNPGDRGFTFDPGSDFQDLALGETRNVTFTYRAMDTHGAIGPVGTVTVSVTGRNEAPVVDPVSVSGAPGQAAINGLFSAVDLDSDEDGGGLIYSIVTPPGSGMVSTSGVPGDRAFVFDASNGFADLAQGETRAVTFTYKASDTHGAQSAPQTVTITVTGANDAPVALPVTSTAVEDGAAVVVSFLPPRPLPGR
jgi:VCBS repeat-containing protein